MHSDKRAKKQIQRLQLRREVVRVLASDDLAAVAGGLINTLTGPCRPSIRPTNTVNDTWD